MKWRSLHAHAIESENGYVILRCNSYGKPTGRFLVLLGRTTREHVPKVLHGCDSADEAKSFAEMHLITTTRAA